MKNKIAIILLVVFSMSFSFGYCEETADFSEEINTVVGLGLMEMQNDDFYADEEVTRGEFALTLAHLVNYRQNSDITANRQIYADLPMWDDYCGAVNFLTERGLINGCEDGTFRPDEPMAFEDACRLLLDIAGYGKYSGGGTLITSADAGLTKGVSGGVLTRAKLAALIYNLLDVKVMEYEEFYSENVKVKKGKTYLEYELGLKRGKGVVTSTEKLSLREKYGAGRGYAKIDNIRYETDMDLSDFLGFKVTYYYDEEKKDTPVLKYAVEAKDNNVVTLFDDDISSAKKSEYTYEEEEKDKTKKLKISSGADFLYNGRLADENSPIRPTYGTVTLIDNTGDETYDVVIVWDYTPFLTTGAQNGGTVVSGTLITDSNKTVSVDSDDAKTYDIYGADGRETTISAISNDMAALLARSEDESYFKLLVSDVKYEGTVDGITNDGDTAVIGEKEYTSASFADVFDEISPGMSIRMYADAFGNIVYVKSNGYNSSWKYGYVIKSGTSEKSAIDPCASFKLLCDDGTIKIIDCDIKIKFNGVKTESEKISVTESSVIRYREENGKITAVDTYTDKSAATELEEALPSAEDCLYRRAEGYYYYKSGLKMFKTITSGSVKGDIGVLDKSVVFKVPKDETNAVDSDYSTVTEKSLSGDRYYTVEAYNTLSDSPFCNAFVIKSDSNYDLVNVSPTIVKSVYNVLNSEGEITYGIKGLTEGVEKSFVLSEADLIKTSDGYTISAGDIVIFEQGGNGEIKKIVVVWTDDNNGAIAGNVTSYGPRDSGFNSDSSYHACTLEQRFDNGYILIQNKNASKMPELLLLNNANVYILDKNADSQNCVKVGRIADVEGTKQNPSEQLVIHTKSTSVADVFVIK